MNSNRYTKSKLYLLLGQFVIIVLCVFAIFYAYQYRIIPEKEVNQNYQKIDCTIINKKLATQENNGKKYRADFLVNYTVGGKKYDAWISANGLDHSFVSDRLSQEHELNQFEENKTYVCWYQPNNLRQIVLVPRHDWTSLYPLFFPTLILIITLYYFFRTLYQRFK